MEYIYGSSIGVAYFDGLYLKSSNYSATLNKRHLALEGNFFIPSGVCVQAEQ